MLSTRSKKNIYEVQRKIPHDDNYYWSPSPLLHTLNAGRARHCRCFRLFMTLCLCAWIVKSYHLAAYKKRRGGNFHIESIRQNVNPCHHKINLFTHGSPGHRASLLLYLRERLQGAGRPRLICSRRLHYLNNKAFSRTPVPRA